MRADHSPPVADSPQAEAWREIEAALDELARLARECDSAGELHSRLLERLVALLSAVGGVVWSVAESGQTARECHLHLDRALDGSHDELQRHQHLASVVALAQQPRLVPPAFRGAGIANATPWLLILCPIVVEQRSIAVVELFQRSDGQAATAEGYQRLVAAACEIVEDFHRRRELAQAHQRQAQLAQLADYLQRIHERLELPAASAAIANEARRVLGCDRVTVLSAFGRPPRVLAISGAASFDRRSSFVQCLERLARSVLMTDEPHWLPAQRSEASPVAGDAEALLEETHARGTGLLPLVIEHDDQRESVGLLCVEDFTGEFDEPRRKQAALVARASAPALANAITYAHIPLRRALQGAAAAIGLGPRRRVSPWAWFAAGLLVAAVSLAVIPADFTVEARGRIWPTARRHLFAPSDAVVAEVLVRDGDRVRPAQPLLRLHSPVLEIDESELVGKQRTVEEDLLAAETAALRSELDERPPAPRGQLTARVEQLKEELRGLEAQLAVVRAQRAQLNVVSPLAGVVITPDAERQLVGRPVKRGDLLLTVAEVGGAWEIELDVADHRAGHIAAARDGGRSLPVTFQLGTDPGTLRRGQVAFVAPATELAADAAPAVRVVAAIQSDRPDEFRPGASVVARIHCGRRSIGYVWFHEPWEAVRLRLFF